MSKGRPRRTPLATALDRIRTKAWFSALKSVSGAKTSYEIAKMFGVTLEKRFEKYARNAVAPNCTTRVLVGRRFPGTQEIFDIGPVSVKGPVPLWKALGGSVEEISDLLITYYPQFEVMRFMGTPHETRVKRLRQSIVPDATRLPDGTKASEYPHDFTAASNGIEPNVIAMLYRENQITVSLEQLTATIAMWRMSMFIGDSTLPMSYLRSGITGDALNDLLGTYGIADDVRNYIRLLEQADIQKYSHLQSQPTKNIDGLDGF